MQWNEPNPPSHLSEPSQQLIHKIGPRIEDLVCCFVPDERLRVLVLVLDGVVDGFPEIFGRAVRAASKLAFGQQREAAFHQIEP